METSKKKIAIIGTVGLPANYGGFETLADHLVKNLSGTYDMTVYCSAKKYKKGNRPSTYNGAKLVYLPLDANGIQSIPYDTISILHAAFYADVLLILGVAGAWILPFIKLFTNKKIIISIDGIEWKRDKWNPIAKLYLWWAEKLAVKYSHIDISDNESIQDYTAVRYGSLSRIIEYGGDHTLIVSPTEEDTSRYPFLEHPYAFKVCRIEPENNVHEVLKAFSEMPNQTLVMVGNWQNSTYGIELKERYSLFSNLILLDPIYNQQTLDMIRGNATMYIHGHSAGGTNPSLVEAMYLGLPIISFRVSYNRTTTESKALYFTNAQSLKKVVNETPISTLLSIAADMKEIANRRYKWSVIAQKYSSLVLEALRSPSKISVTPSISTLNENVLRSYSASHLKHQNMFFEKR